MFFDSTTQLHGIAQRVASAVFVVSPQTDLGLKHPLYLRPSEKTTTPTITIDQLRDFISLANAKETTERFFVIAGAETMNEAAQNAFLKTLEEPNAHCHFILLTEQPSALLPTILSRTQIFFPCPTEDLDAAPQANAKILDLAKQLISAKGNVLLTLATDLSKSKPHPREQTLQAISTAIELLYKSYFKTGNEKFLVKLPNFLKLYENISQNGHIKLQIVANLY